MFFLLTDHAFPDRAFITDANGSQFSEAVKNPERSVDWIVMNSDPEYGANEIWLALHGRQDWQDHFVLRKTFGPVSFYERSGVPPTNGG